MTEARSLLDRLSNKIFAVPLVAQVWAKRAARRMPDAAQNSAGIPFTPMRKPLAECRVALSTTGGIHLPDQPPFEMEDSDGDATFREIPGDVDLATLVITHKYYDHSAADRDPNVIFPLAHLRELAAMGVIGSVAARHFGFMGHIEGEHVQTLIGQTAPRMADLLAQDKVDAVVLTPG